MKYNYLEAVKEDLRAFVADHDYYLLGLDRETTEEWLGEDAGNSDAVTGNASGSYTFNRWTAKEYVIDNLDLLFEAFDCFGDERIGELFKSQDWETMDVIIRFYLLGQAIYEVCNELEEHGYFDAQEEETAEDAAAAAGH